MSLTEQFLNFALLGAEWVLWLLVFLSIFSVGVMIERFLFFRARRVDAAALAADIKQALADGDLESAECRRVAKRVTRVLVDYLLQGKVLHSRSLFSHHRGDRNDL